MKLKNARGITLIALIVTIIVLVLIAGVSIAALTSDNGILRQTNAAKVEQIEGIAREQVKLAVSAMRLAIAEAGARDNSYKASENIGKIQAKLVEILNKDKSGLNGEFGFGGNDLADDATGTELKLNYTGDDYKNACNYENAEIVYTVKLGQKLIEITSEINSNLKDQNGNFENIEVMQLKPGLYASGSEYQVLIKDWNTLVNEGILDENGIIQTGKESDLAGDLVLPNTLTIIGKKAFYKCNQLTDVVIPNTVTSIGSNAFERCYKLVEIDIPDSVTTIGVNAFYYCEALTSIKIPKSVTNIDEKAFYACSALKSVDVEEENTVYHSVDNCLIKTEEKILVAGCENSIIPTDGSVTSIGDYAFEGRVGLTNIEIPNTITEIGDYAFSLCLGLKSIKIPSSVKTIGEAIFKSCRGLESVEIEDGIKEISYHMFWNCKALTSVKLPNTITSIGIAAFNTCESLESIEIPSGVTYIDVNAFSVLTNLKTVTVLANTPPTAGANLFSSCSNLSKIIVPAGKASTYKNASEWSKFSSKIVEATT